MTGPHRSVMLAPYFTPAGYRAILMRAEEQGYCITNFEHFEGRPADRPVLLLRHDLDHSIRNALPIGEIEAERAVRATYFVQIACEFYNLLSQESRGVLRRLIALGHEIGLHYESARYLGTDGPRHLSCDVLLLEDICGAPVRSASQHVPVVGDVVDLKSAIEREAYEPKYTQEGMQYVSDSLMAWRQATPHDLLDERASFQLLTHPMKWVRSPVASMDDALAATLDEEKRALDQGYAQVRSLYHRLLRERDTLDARFRASRRLRNRS